MCRTEESYIAELKQKIEERSDTSCRNNERERAQWKNRNRGETERMRDEGEERCDRQRYEGQRYERRSYEGQRYEGQRYERQNNKTDDDTKSREDEAENCQQQRKREREKEKLCYRFLNGKKCRFGEGCWFSHKEICRNLIKEGCCEETSCEDGHNVTGICDNNKINKECRSKRCTKIHIKMVQERCPSKRIARKIAEQEAEDFIQEGYYHLGIGNLPKTMRAKEVKQIISKNVKGETLWLQGEAGIYARVRKKDDAQTILNMNRSKLGGNILSVGTIYRCQNGLRCKEPACSSIHHMVLESETQHCTIENCKKNLCSYSHKITINTDADERRDDDVTDEDEHDFLREGTKHNCRRKSRKEN